MKVGQHLPRDEYETDQYDITPKNVEYTFKRRCSHPQGSVFRFQALDRRSPNMQVWVGLACKECAKILGVSKREE